MNTKYNNTIQKLCGQRFLKNNLNIKGIGTHLIIVYAAVVSLLPMTSHASSSLTNTTAYDYDPASGMLIKEVVEPTNSNLCLVTAYGLDSYGHQQTITTRNCNGSTGSVSGATTEAATPSVPAAFTGRTTTNTYAGDHRFVTTSTNALSQNQTMTYDGRFGTPNSQTDVNSLTTNWAYDNLGRKVLEQRPDGNGTKWTYQYCTGTNGGNLSCPTINGVAAVYAVTATPVAGPINITAQTTGAANGPYVRVYYDLRNREIRTETQGFDGSGSSTLIYQDTEYVSHRDLIYAKTLPYYTGQTAYWTYYSYDNLGRLTSTIKPNDTSSGATTTTTTSYSGLTTSVTDPRGTTTSVKNVVGQIASITDANGGILTDTYDPDGNLVQTQDAKGNIISSVYDLRGRKTDQYDPDLGVWHYAYDALSELITQTDAKNQVTTLGYDLLGRMTSRSEPSLNSNWYYDTYSGGSTCSKGIGQLCQETATNGFNRALYYDSLGRLSSTATTVGTTYSTAISYDTNGHVASQTYPTNLVINNSYTTLGFLKQVIDSRTGSALWTANNMDALGHVTQYTYGNGIVTTNQYYPSTGRLQNTQAGVNNSVQSLTMSYDSLGRLSSRIDGVNGVTSLYSYDSINRLVNESRSVNSTSTAQTLAWTYNAIGNMLTRTENGITSTYNYNTSGVGSLLPHAVANVSGYVDDAIVPIYTYDANGNITSGAGRNITWTSFNKAQGIVKGSTDLEYLYDADHERRRETYSLSGTLQRTATYINPANGAGLFYDEEGGVAGVKRNHYINAGNVTIGVIECNAATYTTTLCTNSSNTFIQYWHQDHQGSNTVVTDASGNIVERLAYEPFGKRRKANGLTDVNGTLQPSSTHRGYTEHEHLDEVALINMNGRIYDPALGRFISADPTIQAPDNLQSYNRYTYVWNDPLNNTDPTGYDVNEGDSFSYNLDTFNNATASNVFNFPGTSAANSNVYVNLPADTGIGMASNSSYSAFTGRDLTGSDLSTTTSSFGTTWDSSVGNFLSNYAIQVGRTLIDDFVNNNKNNQGIPIYRWLANKLDGTYEKPDSSSPAGIAASATVFGASLLTPGGEEAKVTQEIEAADSAGVIANGARGRASEARVLEELGLTKNTQRVMSSEGKAIPDALTDTLSVEIKDAQSVSLTKQLRIQTEAAQASGRQSILITGERTCVSGPCREAFDQIIRRPDLGPK